MWTLIPEASSPGICISQAIIICFFLSFSLSWVLKFRKEVAGELQQSAPFVFHWFIFGCLRLKLSRGGALGGNCHQVTRERKPRKAENYRSKAFKLPFYSFPKIRCELFQTITRVAPVLHWPFILITQMERLSGLCHSCLSFHSSPTFFFCEAFKKQAPDITSFTFPYFNMHLEKLWIFFLYHCKVITSPGKS